MAIQNITYNTKEALQDDETIPIENKVTADDLNEIKTVVNNNADELTNLQGSEVTQITSNYSNSNITLQLKNSNNEQIDTTTIEGIQEKIANNNKLNSDLISDINQTNKFATSTEKTNWNAKYDKPNTGIPKTDLANDVQTSLDKADTALQEHQDITGKEDKSNKVTELTSESTDTQYPSAKAVYDSQEEQDTEIEKLQTKVTNLEETVNSELEDGTATGTEITVNDSATADASLLPNGNTSQGDNPSTENPQQIHTLKGSNTIKIKTRNQFVIEDAQILNAYFDDVRIQITSSSKARMIYIPCLLNHTYAISKILTQRFRIGYTTEIPAAGVNVYNITADLSSNESYIYTTGNDAKYLCVFPFHGNYDTTITFEDVLNSLQIELGTTVTKYEKGQEQIKTLTLPNGLEMCNIADYRDEFVKQGNNWIVPNKIQKIASYNGETITTPYISTTGGLDTGATVYYVGNTDLAITDTTLIAELDELLELRTYYGQTNIIVEAEDLAPMMKLNYKKSNRAEIKKIQTKSNSSKIFKKVLCVGDSYTAGYIVDGQGTVHENNPEFAFPHYMSLITGNEWLNCGVSGASSKSWLTNANGLAKAQTMGKVQAYIVGLMINDSSDRTTHVNVGTINDVGTENDTYYAYYSKIIRELNTISPNAKIFIETCPKNDDTRYSAYNQAVRDIYNAYKNTYPVHLLDLREHFDLYNNDILTGDEKSGHLTAIGYEKVAEILNELLSDYINNHIADFQDVAFIEYDTNQTE